MSLPARPSSSYPTPHNSLLRCVRQDSRAAPLFEKVEQVPGLWVMELGPEADQNWLEHFTHILAKLRRHEMKLISLREGSEDYTLHLEFQFTEPFQSVLLPPELVALVGQAGIAIEIHMVND